LGGVGINPENHKISLDERSKESRKPSFEPSTLQKATKEEGQSRGCNGGLSGVWISPGTNTNSSYTDGVNCG
jgi:hypothetical protein